MRIQPLILATMLLIGTSAEAQMMSSFRGTGASDRVQANVRMSMPVVLGLTETEAAIQTWEGEGVTEYLAIYTVRGNVRWRLVAEALPAGVMVRDAMGAWTSDLAMIGQGGPTGGAELAISFRISDAAAPGWKRLRSGRCANPRRSAEESPLRSPPPRVPSKSPRRSAPVRVPSGTFLASHPRRV